MPRRKPEARGPQRATRTLRLFLFDVGFEQHTRSHPISAVSMDEFLFGVLLMGIGFACVITVVGLKHREFRLERDAEAMLKQRT